uniref:Canopy FGF signaling regulator 1 n=1 Tax=Maylandia zebra TaxID=106582 RepID=A0A3P9CEE9_9CICH
MTAWVIQMMVMVLSVFTGSSQGKRDKVLYCSACKAIVDELNHSISQVDPKKTINVGSFRLNPDGTMKDKKVPFARSETHLSELLDSVCNSMSDYALYVDPITQHKQYRRFAPRSSASTDDFPDFKNFQFDGPEASNDIKFATTVKTAAVLTRNCSITLDFRCSEERPALTHISEKKVLIKNV